MLPTDAVFGPVFAAGLCAASVSDLFHRRVPNTLNFAFAGVGLAGQALAFGLQGVTFGLLGLGVALAVVLLPFALGVYRGGDAKLVMALGVWLGAERVVWAFLAGALLGGALALFTAWRRGALRDTLARLKTAAATRALPQVEADRPATAHVPMAPAFAAGAALSVYTALHPGVLL